MNKFFSNLSIFKKISLAFFILISFSFVLAGIGIFQLFQIRAITNGLNHEIMENDHFQEIVLTLQTIEGDVESYATVGGEDNKNTFYKNLDYVIRHSDELGIVTDEKTADTLAQSRVGLSELRRRFDALVLAAEGDTGGFSGGGRNLNKEIAFVYEEIHGLRAAYTEARNVANEVFQQRIGESTARINLAIEQFIVFETILLVFALALGFSLSRTLTRPIIDLRDVAAKISAGDYSARSLATGNDEIGDLSRVFNAMAEHLLRYTNELEGEVVKRTEELKQNVVQLNIKNEMLLAREEELTQVNDRLRELDKAKSEFISVAAHQLRTPLSAVKWIMSILIDESSENLTSEQRSLLMKGNESNERMINLVNEMLVVTRIESGKIQFAPTFLHVEDLIENLMLDFSGQTYVRKIVITLDKPPVKLPYVYADPDKLRSVIQNIMENAVKYTPDGGAIKVTVVRDGDVARISFADNGIGIPEKQKTAIFNKFFRADNAIKRQTDGSGLGLFIAKNMLEKQGGRIWFESEEGKGTVFTMELPLSKDIQA